VLEQVGEPGSPRSLVLRADVVPEIDRRERQPAIDVEDDPEAVREAMAEEREVGESRHGGGSIRDGATCGKRKA
jgi:hypothetical protein